MINKALTVSIVIPAYNEENHLKACLDAIAAQTVMPDEVFVVDNNSTDKTAAIAHSYKFVTLLKEPNQGIAWARDRGFNASRSSILARIDADSRIPLDWVERVRDFYADSNNANMALTGGCTFYNVRQQHLHQWISSQFIFRMNRALMGHYILWGSNMAMPKKFWTAVKKDTCTRTDIHEDLDLSIHLHRLGYQIHYDATLIVAVKMLRVFNSSAHLWPRLKMWPRTLQVHHFKNWPCSYVGAAFIWCMQVVPRTAEWIAVKAGRPPLN